MIDLWVHSLILLGSDVSQTTSSMGWEWVTASLPYGNKWRLHRRVLQQYFRPEASQGYLSVQKNKTHQLLRQLLDAPEHFAGHLKTWVWHYVYDEILRDGRIRSLSASTIMEILYGIDITSEHDPYIQVAEKAITMGANSLFPGAALCNIIPSRT